MALNQIERIFLNQEEAGAMLGHSGEWLRLQAKRHPLYKASDGVNKSGVRARYHREHIEIISLHLMNKESFTEDDALIAWQRWNQERIGEKIGIGEAYRSRSRQKSREQRTLR